METKLQREINKLPGIQKAHIYEPKIEDVVKVSFRAGIREVVEAIKTYDKNYSHTDFGNDKFRESVLWWLNPKLKEWGIDKGE